MPRRAMAAVAVSMLVLAGCGGGDENGPSTTAPPVGTDVRADTNRARGIVLGLSDVPPGFAPATAAGPSQNDAEARELSQCIGFRDDPALRTVDWSGPDFQNVDDRIGSNVEFKRDAANARFDLDALRTEQARACIRQTFEKVIVAAIGGQFPVRTTATEIAALNSADTAAVRITGTVGEVAVSNAYFDLIMTVVDRIEMTLTFTYVNEEPPADLEASLLTRMRERASGVLTAP